MDDEASPPFAPIENPFGENPEAVGNIKAAEELANEPGPDRFFSGKRGGGKLLANALQEAVEEQLTLARAPGRILYLYAGGVWRPGGGDAVRTRVVELLGDHSRKNYGELMVENIFLTTKYEIVDKALPDFINFTNGMLQWRTGTLLPHAPEYLSTNQLPFDWDPTATCPRTDQFMTEVFHTDAAWIGYEILGYCMLDANPYQKGILLVGDGENGKTVYLRLVEAMLGSDNVSAVPLQDFSGGDAYGSSELFGKLANIAGDISSRMIEDTSTFKKITGGDIIRAQRKYQHAFNFHAKATPLFSANEIPGSADVTHGYTRRWLVAEFPNRFGEDRREEGLIDVLAAEVQGVAVKAVEALRLMDERGGFMKAESLDEAHENMVLNLNPVQGFCDECIELSDDGLLTRSEVYKQYETWCKEEGRHPVTARKFWGRFRTVMARRIGRPWVIDEREAKRGGVRRVPGICFAPSVVTFPPAVK